MNMLVRSCSSFSVASWKEYQTGRPEPWVPFLALSLTPSVTLDKLLSHSADDCFFVEKDVSNDSWNCLSRREVVKINEILFIKHSELSERKVLYKYGVLLVLFNNILTSSSLYIFQNLGRVIKSEWRISHDTCLFPPLKNCPLSLPLFNFLYV